MGKPVMGPKRGDREPSLVLNISDDVNAANLNTMQSWRVLGRRRGDLTGVLLIDVAPTSVVVDSNNTAKAVVTLAWPVGSTDVGGMLQFEVEGTWPGGKKQTFPNTGFMGVMIDDDLG